MIIDGDAMAIAVHKMNIGSTGKIAAKAKQTAPTAKIRADATDVCQRRVVAKFTTHGDSSRPTLPPAAIKPLATEPAWNQRTAITSRKVLPAVSITPEEIARKRSNRNVRAVRPRSDINREAPSELRREAGRARPNPQNSHTSNTSPDVEIQCEF